MKSSDPTKRPPSVRANRADHVVGNAAGQTAGTGSGTQPNSDWMAEMSPGGPGVATDPAAGVPVTTRTPGDRSRGRSVESKRGQR